MPVEERGLRRGGMSEERKPAGVALPTNPARRGGEFQSITCESEGAGPIGGSVPPGREQARRRDGKGHRADEAVQLLEAGGRQATGTARVTPSRRSVCERHDPAGEPDAGNPHVRFGGQGVETDLWEPD